MNSTMQQRPLLISDLFDVGEQIFSKSEVTTVFDDHYEVATFAEVALLRPDCLGCPSRRSGRYVSLE